MERIARWIYTAPYELEGHLRLVVKIVFICFVYATLVSVLLVTSGIETTEIKKGALGVFAPSLSNQRINLSSFDIFVYAAIEEIIFRFLVLGVAVKVFWRRCSFDQFLRLLFAMALISSIIFGLAHGAWYNILIQGVGGMLFCGVFLKCGGIYGKFFTGCFWSTVAHAMYNTLILFIIRMV